VKTNTAMVVSALSALVLPALPSHAELLTWTLDGVTLQVTSEGGIPTSNGGSFTEAGSLVYDAQTHIVQDWNITGDGRAFGLDLAKNGVCDNPPEPCQVAQWSAGSIPGSDHFLFSRVGTPAGSYDLEFSVPRLTDSGGIKTLIAGSFTEGGIAEFTSQLTAGRLVAVPEPSLTAAYLALGVVALCVVGARRRLSSSTGSLVRRRVTCLAKSASSERFDNSNLRDQEIRGARTLSALVRDPAISP
jgi:hypothetical protein